MKPQKFNKNAIAAAMCLIASLRLVNATEDDYNSTTSGNLTSASQWSLGIVPTTSNEAVFKLTNTSALSIGHGPSASVAWGDIVWNTNQSNILGTNTGFSGETTSLTLSGGGGSTAAVAAGGVSGDLIVVGTTDTNGTLSLGGNAAAGTDRITIALGTAGNFDVVNAGATLNIVGGVSGNFNLTKTGSGTLIFGSNSNVISAYTNTFGSSSTAFTISSGLVQMAGFGTLGSTSNGLIVNGTSILDLNATSQTVGNFSGSGGTILNNAASGIANITIGNGTTAGVSGTYSGVIADHSTGSGSVALTKTGAGTTTLSGSNTYSGGTIVNGGTLTVGTGGTLGAATGALTVSNSNTGAGTAVVVNLATAVDTITGSLSGTVAAPSSGTNTATINNGGSGRNFTVNQTTSGTYAGILAGVGTLTLGSSSTGSLTLSGANTYSGGTTVSAGTLIAGISNSGSTSGAFGASNGITGLVTLGDANTTSNHSSPALLINAGGVTVANPIAVSNHSTSGVYTIGGSNATGTATYSGNVTLNQSTTLQAATGGTVDFKTGTWTTNNNVFLIGSSGNTGTVEVDNALATSGGVTVNAGALLLGNTLNVAGGTLAVTTAGTLSSNSSGTVTGNATVTGGGIINFNSASAISGTLGVTGGNWNGAGSVTGLITSSSGVFSIGTGANLTASSGINVTGGSIVAGSTSSTINGSLNYTSSSSSNFGGVIAGSTNVVTLNNASAVLTLSGASANTYTGVTTVSSGEFDLSKTSNLANGINNGGGAIVGNILINGGTLKDLASEQIDNGSAITQTSGTFNLNSMTETVGSYTKSGGTFILGNGGKLIGTGSSVSLSNGNDIINADGSITDGHVALDTETLNVHSVTQDGGVTTGGVLQVNGGGIGLVLNNANTVNLTSDSSSAKAGSIALNGNVTTSGTGLDAIATTGANAVAGHIDLGGTGTRTFTIADTVAGAGTDMLVSAVITGGSGNSLTKNGAGTLEVTGANTYSGGTVVTAGTLLVNNTSGSGTGSGVVTIGTGTAGSGTLAGTGNITTISGVTISAGGTLASGTTQTTAPNVNPAPPSVAGLTLTNTSLTVGTSGSSIAANLTFDLGANNGGNVGSIDSFGSPNTNSTYLTLAGSSSINFAGVTSISLVDLTNGNLALRLATPYLLISAASDASYSGLVTELNGVLGYGDGYVVGVGTDTIGGYTPISIAQFGSDGVTPLSPGPTGIYPVPQLYLNAGNLEVVPEPGTWAMMLGGLALLITYQRWRKMSREG